MNWNEKITLALIVVFGLAGAWLYETFNEFGEWLSNFCVIPPLLFYLVIRLKTERGVD